MIKLKNIVNEVGDQWQVKDIIVMQKAHERVLKATKTLQNAVNNLEQILKVKGLDAIIVGPYDLSASMGLIAEFDNKEFISVMNRIISLCNRFNISCGDHVVEPNPELLEKRIGQGYRFLALSVDSVFLHNFCQCPKLKL